MAKIKLNLKAFFENECNILIKSHKNLLARRQGVSLDKAPNNRPSTIKKKGKDHWLVDSGNTKNKGFEKQSTVLSMKVYANPKTHAIRSDVTYEYIFDLHNQKGYSGIFEKLPVGSQLPKRLENELDKQILPQLAKLIPRIIK